MMLAVSLGTSIDMLDADEPKLTGDSMLMPFDDDSSAAAVVALVVVEVAKKASNTYLCNTNHA